MDEATRVKILADYGAMSSGPDEVLDGIANLAAQICAAPFALVNLIDGAVQTTKAAVGWERGSTPREGTFCEQAIAAREEGLFVVPDARIDPRFASNPMVAGEPHIVFYAGAPLVAERGAKLGAICVIDREPRELTAGQAHALETLAKMVVAHLRQRRDASERAASEAWLHAVLGSIGEAVISTDTERRVTYLNDVARGLTGWVGASPMGARIEQLSGAADGLTTSLEQALRAPAADGAPKTSVASLVRRDGNAIPIVSTSTPLRQHDGTVTGAVAVFRDVSEEQFRAAERTRLEAERERAFAEAETARAEAQRERTALSLLFERAPLALSVLRGPTHIIDLANAEICGFWGRAPDDVLGKPLFEAMPELVGQGLEALLSEVLATGKPVVERERPVQLARGPRGEIVDCFFTFVYQPMRDADGGSRRVLVVANDVTENVIARKELERIFVQSLDLLAACSETAFTRVNPAFQRTLGWEPADLYGAASADFVHPEDRGAWSAVLRDLSSGRLRVHAFENRLRHKDNTYRWIAWNMSAEGRTVYCVGRDISGEKAVEEIRAKATEEKGARLIAERANMAMDEFLATVSHELRTPLSAMLGWTRLLRSGSVAEPQREKALATIERNAVAQAQLIEDLLDVSRIISGKMRLDLAAVDCAQVIEAAIDVVQPSADAKNIRVDSILDPSAGEVTADPSRLQQVVWNLLSNAIKFTPKGGRVQVRLARVASSVEITVSDSGEGIDPSFLDHVFDRFRQADGTTARVHGGLGLGLAIVKTIVELHGGSVFAESGGRGTGATFFVRLPVAPVRQESAARVSSSAPPRSEVSPSVERPAAVAGIRVLVVDDEQDGRDLIHAVLSHCGAVVTMAASTAEALEIFDAGHFDLVISDIGMPGADGYALVRELRSRPLGKTGRLPIIALTAYARASDRTRALRAGFSAHVSKPIEPSELIAVVATAIEQVARD